MSIDHNAIERLRNELGALQKTLRQTVSAGLPEPVQDYTLRRADGSPVRLGELFGAHDELLVVHNMGRRCVYCTLWADGFIGLAAHLANRAAFVLSSPDEPAVLREFSTSRGWPFPCVSTHGSTFTRDMGYEVGQGEFWPGVSAFRKTPAGIERTARDFFGPGDSYCGLWHLMELLPKGVNDWAPKYTYT